MVKKIEFLVAELLDKFSTKTSENLNEIEKQIKKITKNKKIKIEKLEKENLFLKTNNPSWKMELNIKQEEIKKKLTNSLSWT